MIEKRFWCLDKYKGETSPIVDEKFTTTNGWLCNKLNELNDENEKLKQALLFFLDVANGECSSNFEKDMEHDCQKLFNCSYDEAEKKYGSYDATWWELGE